VEDSWLTGPNDLIRRFGAEMDRVLENLGVRREIGNLADQIMDRPFMWSPQVEVVEKDDQLVIRADLPGLKKDEITIDLADDAVTIEGERKEQREESHEGYYRSERSYGRFHRRIPLPAGVDTETATAQFSNGVLEIGIALPEAKERKARKIEIADGSPARARAAGR
jgi:HSP20 family protein